MIKKILNTPDFEDEKTYDLLSRLSGIKKQGFITKDQGIEILKWKSPRPLRYYEKNSDSDFREISRIAFSSKEERVKIHILTALEGVHYPAASAILMFYDKKKYPVIDIRVWQQLHNAGLVKTNPRGQGFRLNEWITYLNIIRNIASETNLTARQVEKRLFDIDREERDGNLYQK